MDRHFTFSIMLGEKLLVLVVAMLAVYHAVVLSQDSPSSTSEAPSTSSEASSEASSASSEASSEASSASSEASSEASSVSSEASSEASTTSSEASSEASTASGETTTETATASGASESTTNANPNPAVNQICPGNPGMVDATRMRALVAHNYRRGRLAVGLVRNKNRRTLPTASNMRYLDYNCTLESSAMKSAKRCSVLTDPSLPNGVQENNYLFPKNEASSDENALITVSLENI
ncbi:hypothetical protein TELCIR_10830 [Teladorsagia circumcincta]|uniref:SCP domain-containing protein n=1 Tax=Teladorsagia circumcincta TaxID=45464 RepID=A0A2G9UB18_TELCI|nr:hypothetical protein TELCIR_10830 [Teladorsagia circumcincta]